jgi:hypothetical protein
LNETLIHGFTIRPWTADQLITIAPLLWEVAKMRKETSDPADVELKIFALAPEIIGVSLGIDREVVRKWEGYMVWRGPQCHL